MGEICNDGRFDIIEKAKADILGATNIETSEDEMKVLDNFLFRCWQMGWLKRYTKEIEEKIKEIEALKENVLHGFSFCCSHDIEKCKLNDCRGCVIDHCIDILKGETTHE